MARVLSVYLNLNSGCNLNCSFCFEGNSTTSSARFNPRSLDFIDNILKSNLFKEKFGILELRLSGGEPTLSSDAIVNLLSRYQREPVIFTLKTNGYHIPEELKRALLLRKDERLHDRPKIETHISYNGRRAQDLNRLSHGKSTTNQVRETIDWFINQEVPFFVITTLTIETLPMLFETYEELNEFSNAPSLVEKSFFPTFDYLEKMELSTELRNELILNLKKIAAKILRERKRGNTPLNFEWFGANAINNCPAGSSYFTIDVDGSIYPCYLCAFDEEKNLHRIGSIEDSFEYIAAAGQKYAKLSKVENETCNSCTVSFCIKCPAARFRVSTKKTYEEKWTDLAGSSIACEISRTVEPIARAFRRLNENPIH
jgi:radical SAM protein with 4Fe4S-binding SPASM domain